MEQIIGYKPLQLTATNKHRPNPIRAIGLTPWCKAQIAAAILLGAGSTMIGLCMIYAMATGAPQ